MSAYRIYGDSRSGNCLKVKWTADRLSLHYEWAEIDVVAGATRTKNFLALNPAGQVPLLITPEGRPLAQSNAIIVYLAERHGRWLLPEELYERATVFEWLFWEQYSHEPYIAVRRFQKSFLKKSDADIDPKLMERGLAALTRLEQALRASPFLVGEALTLADISLVAYTRVAHEGGFDLNAFPAVRAWIARTEDRLGIGVT
jgi:glutathione S-transferase